MMIGIAQFLLVTAVAFAGLALLASHIRFQRMTQAARDPDTEERPPVDAFTAEVAHRLGTAHRDPEPFCLMLLQPIAAPGQTHSTDTPALLGRLEEMARNTVRAGDCVMPCGSDSVGVLVMVARDKAEGIARRLLERTRHRSRSAGTNLPPGIVVIAGVATHPENGTRTQTLLQTAREAMESARRDPSSHLALAASEPLPSVPASVHPDAPRGLLDELTGVLREHRVISALQRELSHHRKENRPLSVLFADIDHLDRYNEHYGREAGDRLLKGAADALQHHVRETDLIGRLEGDGFLLILECEPVKALPIAQRLIHELRKVSFAMPTGSLRVSMSIGVAGYPDHSAHPRDLTKAARHALRAAKNRGGSRCAMFEPAMQTVAEEMPREVDAL
ncbi:MAG: diguanylate cyclase [Verrucomicrobia bacterium]|nr:diguanylate cyclase [Verrucomicrobiota bacterium]